MSGDAPTRCGFVALLGAPNVGKSTLLNRMAGARLSIVTHKAQTTRRPVRGVVTRSAVQMVFVDTPGIRHAALRDGANLPRLAWAAAAGADLVALMADAARTACAQTDAIVRGLVRRRQSFHVILNKTDLAPPARLLRCARPFGDVPGVRQVFMVSARTGAGVEDVVRAAAEEMPPGPWLYPSGEKGGLPRHVLAAEIVREKLTLRLHQELPYVLRVEPQEWRERPDGSVVVRQVIRLPRASQKQIVLGRGGSVLRSIGVAARMDLEQILGVRVHLFLTVSPSARAKRVSGARGGKSQAKTCSGVMRP